MQAVSMIDAKKYKIKKVSFYHNNEIEEHHLFDTLGNPYESKYYLSIYSKRIRKYDKWQKLVEEVEFDDDDGILDRKVIKYNKAKLPVVMTLYDNEGILYTDSTFYTRDGKEKEYMRYSKRGNIKFGFLYKYDEKGKLISKKEVDAKKQLAFRTSYKYNKNGRLVTETSYDAADKLDLKWETIYDERGNEVKTYCIGNCSNGGWVNKFNDASQVIEYIELNDDGTIESVFSYNYDENGNKVETKLMNAKGEIIEIQKIKYNEQNLVIEKWKSGDDIYRAEYEYY